MYHLQSRRSAIWANIVLFIFLLNVIMILGKIIRYYKYHFKNWQIFMNKYMNYFFCILGNNKTVFSKVSNLGMSYSQLFEEELHASSMSSGPAQDQHIPELLNNNANGSTDSSSFKKAHHGFVGTRSEREVNEWILLADILDKSFCILLSIVSAISVAKICHPSSISTFWSWFQLWATAWMWLYQIVP